MIRGGPSRPPSTGKGRRASPHVAFAPLAPGGAIKLAAGSKNGLGARPSHDAIGFDVPEAIVHSRSRTNVLELQLPPGCALRHLDLQSLGTWWQ